MDPLIKIVLDKNYLELKRILNDMPEGTTAYSFKAKLYCQPQKFLIYEDDKWSISPRVLDEVNIDDIKEIYDSIRPCDPGTFITEVIVSAANRDPESGVIYPCVRHGCDIFWGLIDDKYNDPNKCTVHFDQGFLTNKYRYVDREEAYIIAVANNQIRQLCPTGSNSLYSEMLY